MENMVNPEPRVSVIMNCYNSARYLAEAIDSVYAQTFDDWEIVFLDNCSTDNSAAVARRYDGRLRYFCSEKNVPLGEARNLAIEKTRGQYLAFLDCDDLWLPDKLARQVKVLDEDPLLGAVFSDALFFGEKGRSFRTFPGKVSAKGVIFRDLLRRYVLPMPTVMIRRDVRERAGGWFDPRFHMVEDADLFLRIAFHYPMGYVGDVLARRRMHAGSWTARKKELFPQEEELLLKKFSVMWPLFEQDYAAEIFYRRAIIQYQYAILDWEKGDSASARKRIAPYLWVSKKFWVPFLLSYLPIGFYFFLKHRYKSVIVKIWGGVDDQVF